MRDPKTGRFVQGASGNPGGRPKGVSVLAEIDRQLELEDDDSRPRRERLVEKLFERALAADPDMKAMELLLKRVAPERLALEGESRTTLTLKDFTGLQYEVRRELAADAVLEVQVQDPRTGAPLLPEAAQANSSPMRGRGEAEELRGDAPRKGSARDTDKTARTDAPAEAD